MKHDIHDYWGDDKAKTDNLVFIFFLVFYVYNRLKLLPETVVEG